MWIMSKTGFISIVQHNDSPDDLLVRARALEDLEDFLEPASHPPASLSYDIQYDPAADYWFRVVVPRDVVATLVADQIDDLDYTTNVKGNCDKGDQARHSAMMSCWSAFNRFQTTHDAELDMDEEKTDAIS
jgi:hypothetical protein